MGDRSPSCAGPPSDALDLAERPQALSTCVFSRDFQPRGWHVVEASAGTGKTHAIQTLYLRVILEMELTVDRVVVVTFTEAATHELRARIRAILQKALSALDGTLDPQDPDAERIQGLLHALLHDTTSPTPPLACSPEEWALRLRQALADFDQAAISTIHGFCHRILREWAFECRQPFERHIVGDRDALVREVCEDWWRQALQHDPSLYAAMMQWDILTLRRLFTTARTVIARSLANHQLRPLPMPPDEVRRALGPRLSDPTPKKPRDKSLLRLGYSLLHHAAVEIRNEYESRKRNRMVLTFDDMLTHVRDALNDPQTGPRLLAQLRERYRAVLVDEFQDTDPVQYEILRTLFTSENIPVFLVGDPKQAIYAFRGGDIYTYYDASEKIPPARKLTLDTNYRSEGALVEAINFLFRDTQDRRTFIHPQIPYHDVRAKGLPPSVCLQVHGRTDPHPFKLWIYPGGHTLPAENAEVTRRVYNDVAEEIVRLLQDDTVRIGRRTLRPSDIAILVATHREAEQFQYALRVRRRVPAVLQSASSVWESPEAQDMYTLLAALAEPGHTQALRAALATNFFPGGHQAMLRGPDAERATPSVTGEAAPGLDAFRVWFQEAHRLWIQGSPIRALYFLFDTTGARVHLVRQENGERRLTNVLQLADLVHQAAQEQALGPHAALNWFAAQMESTERELSQAHELRLESDADAVRILTVYRSKGLQFPIVFVPTLWRRRTRKHPGSPGVLWHEPSDSDQEPRFRLLFSPSTDAVENDKIDRERRERLHEHIRLFYVAVTRAIHRVYVVAFTLSDEKENTALTHVLGASAVTQRLRRKAHCTDRMPIDLVVRSARGSTTVSVYQPLLASADTPLRTQAEREGLTVTVHTTCGHTSFSALTGNLPRSAGVDDRYDFDASDETPPAVTEGAEPPDPLFVFPAGPQTGECWHAILERLDFQASDDVLRAVVRQELDRYNVLPHPASNHASTLEEAVFRMIRGVLDLPLPTPEGNILCLRDVQAADRRAELDFSFTLADAPRTTAEIGRILRAHWATDASRRIFLETLHGWDQPIPRGFLTGFMDLVFRAHGRYYIVDWKSNTLEGTVASFDHARLRQEMAKHRYVLQYLLYTVALDRYLRGFPTLGYTYGTGFGGVYYVFLRGLENRETHGIFFDRPSELLIRELANYLIGHEA